MPSSSTNGWNDATYGNGVFVAVNSDNGAAAASSTNGTSWTARSMPSTSTWAYTAFSSDVFVAIGGTNVAASSTDGITWTSRTMPFSASWTSATGAQNVL